MSKSQPAKKLYLCKIAYEQYVEAISEDDAKHQFIIEVVPLNADLGCVEVIKTVKTYRVHGCIRHEDHVEGLVEKEQGEVK